MLAAAAGGYTIAWLWSASAALLLHHVLGLARADAALLATLIGFLVFPVPVLSAFAARNATRAWIYALIAALPPTLVMACLSVQSRP